MTMTPSYELNHSIFSGVIPGQSEYFQNRVELEIELEDLIMVRDVYVDALSIHSVGKPLETLVLFVFPFRSFEKSKLCIKWL